MHPIHAYLLDFAELKRQVVERFGDVSLSCPPNGLNSKAAGILKNLATE